MLAADPDGTKVLAGGQSLVPVLNMRLAAPEAVLDISRIPALAGASAAPDGSVRYGACTVHADFEDGRVPDIANGLLRTVAAGIGYRAVRNRGTVGGSLAHADPSAEWPVVMPAMNATVLARSVTGQREIACAALTEGYFTTALHPDEILSEVRLPPASPTLSWGLCKIARKAGEFADSIAVAVIDGEVARVWLGGAAGTPIRLAAVEAAVMSSDSPTPQDVAGLVAADLAAAGAADADDEYRRHLHGVSCWRAVRDATVGSGDDRHEEAS